MKKRIWLGIFILIAGLSRGAIQFAPIFSDGAVLQCEMNVNIWGTADPGEGVIVSFAGQEKSTVADDKGRWLVQLDPMPPSSEPRVLLVVSQVSGFKCPRWRGLVGDRTVQYGGDSCGQ